MLAISGPAKLDDISVIGFTAIHAQLEWTKNLSPFHWYLGGEPLENGFPWDGIGLLAATAAVLVAADAWRFTHRDVSV